MNGLISYTVFRHKSASLRFYNWGNGRATISHLHSDNRNKGHATALLKKVVKLCDANKLTVLLEVRRHKVRDGLSQTQLAKFYQKFGFKLIWGKPVLMERTPKKRR